MCLVLNVTRGSWRWKSPRLPPADSRTALSSGREAAGGRGLRRRGGRACGEGRATVLSVLGWNRVPRRAAKSMRGHMAGLSVLRRPLPTTHDLGLAKPVGGRWRASASLLL